MKKICEACTVFSADCSTPIGDGAADLCWLCAHMVTHHGMAIGPIPSDIECSCPKEHVYPAAVLRARANRERFLETRGSFESLADLEREYTRSLSPQPSFADNRPHHKRTVDGQRKLRESYERWPGLALDARHRATKSARSPQR